MQRNVRNSKTCMTIWSEIKPISCITKNGLKSRRPIPVKWRNRTLSQSSMPDTTRAEKCNGPARGSHVARDSWVSVMYPEGLNSAKSSGILQRTDRHGILDQKRSDFQEFVYERQPEYTPTGPSDGDV